MVVRPLPVLAAAVLAAALPLAAVALPPSSSPLILPGLTAPAAATQDLAPDLAEDAAAAALPAPLDAAAAAAAERADGGDEYAIEYEVTLREANSLLNRLSARLKHLVEQAWTFLGTPYRRGGTSRSGLDCSGLVGAVYAAQGVEMPRTAAEQFAQGQPVAEGELRPGDLVFFRDTYKRGISHVGIFVGDGRFIHAAGRRQGVIVSELTRPYFRSRFAGARRLSPLAAQAGAAALPPG